MPETPKKTTKKTATKAEPKNLYLKLFELQNDIGAITKDKENPFYKSMYADINSMIDQLKPLLEKHRLVIMQPITFIEDKPALETYIIDPDAPASTFHTIHYLPQNEDPQKMGSIITYFRRYALQSMLFLQAEDDDANMASNTPPKKELHPTDSRRVCITCKQEFNPNPKAPWAKECLDCWKAKQDGKPVVEEVDGKGMDLEQIAEEIPFD